MNKNEKPVILVLFGGMSPEYPVSLESAHAVITHLDRDKYTVLPLGITRDGRWRRFDGPAECILADTWHTRPEGVPAAVLPCRQNGGLVENHGGSWQAVHVDAAFPVMHGAFGEDGTVQGLLELAGIPVIGCGTLASAICMDKARAHLLAGACGARVPKGAVFGKAAAQQALQQAAQTLGWPLFVKPVRAGSSFGIGRVEGPAGLAAAVEEARRFDTDIMLEEAVAGFEVGCAVLGAPGGELVVGEVDEVELAEGFFDFAEKYGLITSKIHVPARLAPALAARVKQTAAQIYKALGCGGFARVDMFITPQKDIVFNEVNTIPGFTAHSRYPAMMKAAGLEFAPLLDRLVETAVAL